MLRCVMTEVTMTNYLLIPCHEKRHKNHIFGIGFIDTYLYLETEVKEIKLTKFRKLQ